MTTIKEIVKEYLEKNGFDGLYDTWRCACLLTDNDFMICDEPRDCRAGYKGPCTCGDGHDYDVYDDKAVARAAAEKAR